MSAIRGRGAPSNRESSRFNLPARQADGEWLDWLHQTDEEARPKLHTTVTRESARTIITRNNSPDIGFDQSINAYRGCDQSRNGCVCRFGRSSQICQTRISRQRRTRLNGNKVRTAQGGSSNIVKTKRKPRLMGHSNPMSQLVTMTAQSTSQSGISAQAVMRLNLNRDVGRKPNTVAKAAPAAANIAIVDSEIPSHIRRQYLFAMIENRENG